MAYMEYCFANIVFDLFLFIFASNTTHIIIENQTPQGTLEEETLWKLGQKGTS